MTHAQKRTMRGQMSLSPSRLICAKVKSVLLRRRLASEHFNGDATSKRRWLVLYRLYRGQPYLIICLYLQKALICEGIVNLFIHLDKYMEKWNVYSCIIESRKYKFQFWCWPKFWSGYTRTNWSLILMRGSFVHFSSSVCAGRDWNREIIHVHIDIPFSFSV